MVCGTSYLSDDDVAALPPAVHRRLSEVLHYASYFYYHCEQEGSYRMQLCQILTADWRSKFFAAMSTAVIGDDANNRDLEKRTERETVTLAKVMVSHVF